MPEHPSKPFQALTLVPLGPHLSLFQGRELCLSTSERVGVYRLLVSFMKEHFGDDARGRQKAWYFLPWHFDFFNRWGYGRVERGQGVTVFRGKGALLVESPTSCGRAHAAATCRTVITPATTRQSTAFNPRTSRHACT